MTTRRQMLKIKVFRRIFSTFSVSKYKSKGMSEAKVEKIKVRQPVGFPYDVMLKTDHKDAATKILVSIHPDICFPCMTDICLRDRLLQQASRYRRGANE